MYLIHTSDMYTSDPEQIARHTQLQARIVELACQHREIRFRLSDAGSKTRDVVGRFLKSEVRKNSYRLDGKVELAFLVEVYLDEVYDSVVQIDVARILSVDGVPESERVL